MQVLTVRIVYVGIHRTTGRTVGISHKETLLSLEIAIRGGSRAVVGSYAEDGSLIVGIAVAGGAATDAGTSSIHHA